MDGVLLVEDEAGIRDALCDYLRLQGVSLSSARDAADARGRLAGGGVTCLVTDENLPDGSGRRLIAEFLAAGGRRALLATANPSDEIEGWAESLHEVEVARKPLRPGAVLAWLRAADARPTRGSDRGRGLDERGARAALGLLVERGFAGEELERCMILVLALGDDAALVDCRREGARVLLTVDPGPGGAGPRPLALPAELGVRSWVAGDGHAGYAVPLPWRRLERAGRPETVDMRDEAFSPFDRIVEVLSRACDAGEPVANLASWHRAALELSGLHDLIPPRARADESTCPERDLLFDEGHVPRASQA